MAALATTLPKGAVKAQITYAAESAAAEIVVRRRHPSHFVVQAGLWVVVTVALGISSLPNATPLPYIVGYGAAGLLALMTIVIAVKRNQARDLLLSEEPALPAAPTQGRQKRQWSRDLRRVGSAGVR